MSIYEGITHARRKIAGIGIVCGLELIVGGDCTLKITKGYGITSAGLIIHFSGDHYKYYTSYEEQVKGLSSKDKAIDIWELSKDQRTNSKPLSPQAIEDTPFIEGKIVLLYLEDIEQAIIKPLLINKEDAWTLISQAQQLDLECLDLDGVEEDDIPLFTNEEEFPSGQRLFCVTNRNTSLPPIYLMRFGFATTETECSPEEREFSLTTNDFEGLLKEYKTITEKAIEHLEVNIKKLHTATFSDLIPQQQSNYLNLYLAYLKDIRLASFVEDDRKIYIQCFYDFIKDLVSTYNELVTELCHLQADCCPNAALFPCHLLLGEAQPDISFGWSVFRNHFRQPPIYNDNQLRFQKVRFLHWRMVIQIKNFYIPSLEQTDFAEGHYTQIEKNNSGPTLLDPIPESTDNNIKITPFERLGLPLGKQPIPFYYYVSNDLNSIHHFWDFEVVYCCGKQHLISYYADSENAYTNICAVKRPLSYDHTPSEFYRIEGIIGSLVETDKEDILIKAIKDLQLRYNIDFKIKRLSFIDFFEDYDNDEDFQIKEEHLGAEHIKGVKKGDTYILLYNEEGKVIADFWKPCCETTIITNPPPVVTPADPPIDDGNNNEVTGRIRSGCPGVTLPIDIIKINGEELLVENGGFKVPLPPGSYPIEIIEEGFYSEKTEIVIPEDSQAIADIVVYPYQTATAQLTLENGGLINPNTAVTLTTEDGKPLTDINGDSLRLNPSINGTIQLPPLKNGPYNLEWRNEATPVMLDPCIVEQIIEAARKGRDLLPWEDPAITFPEDLIPPGKTREGLSEGNRALWDKTGKNFQEILEIFASENRAEVVDLIGPYLFEQELTQEELVNTLDKYIQYAKDNLDKFKDEVHREDFSKLVTEMHLNRVIVITPEFDESIYDYMGIIAQEKLIPEVELEGFVNGWTEKVAEVVTKDFKEAIVIDKLTERVKIGGIDLLTGRIVNSIQTRKVAEEMELDKNEIYGLGKVSKEWLAKNGIRTMKELAAITPEKLKELILRKKSLKTLDTSTWSQQAKLFIEDKKKHAQLYKQLQKAKKN